MNIEEKIKELIVSACKELGLPEIEADLSRPADEKFGDFSSNAPLKIKSQISNLKNTDENAKFNNPRQIAEAIVENLKSQISNLKSIEKIEVAGPGFINFYLSDEYFVQVLGDVSNRQMLKQVQHDDVVVKQKRVVVEYSSPNIAKPFTVGHLRSTIIGDAVANILEANGHEVLRDNHLGDWGTQFGKQIAALMELGEGTLEANLEKIEKSENPVKDLVELYVEFHQKAEENPQLEEKGRAWFKKLEDGDTEARELWQKCIDWSWKEFARIYDVLKVPTTGEFQNSGRGYGESYFEDKMAGVINELSSKNLLQEGKEGAKLVFFPEEMNMPPLMILKGDGATLYATRDLATDKFRKEQFHPDMIVNEVGAEQSLYFRQVYEVEKMLGWYSPGQRVHVGHGHFRFLEGKMSTRKGNVIWLQDVLEEAIKRAGELSKESGQDAQVTKQVAIGALKWNDLKGSPDREIVFDWDEILNMKGNSGPYVQYTFARTRSVLGKAPNYKSQITKSDQNYKLNDEEKAVVRQLSRYSEAVARAGEELSPQVIASYVYDLAQRFNSFYNKHSILGVAQNAPIANSQSQIGDSMLDSSLQAPQNDAEGNKQLAISSFRLALTEAVGETIKNGLGLLGIEAPSKM